MGQMAVREANRTSLRDESKTATNASKVPPTRFVGIGGRQAGWHGRGGGSKESIIETPAGFSALIP
jgi:hypothetical protein